MKQDGTNELIKRHEGLIFYTLGLLGCSHSDEAISVAYEALWRAIKTFDSTKGTQFSTYASKCIRNAVYDLFRVWKEIKDAEVPLEEFMNLSTVDDYGETTEQPINPIVSNAVDDTLNKLSPKRRSIVSCWLDSNMSATAIAKEVGCSQSYASQVLKEFKVALKKELINAGYCADSNSYRQ